MNPLRHDNVRYLEQALDLLALLDDETYRQPCPPLFHSGIGAHLRHVLDHYRSFLDGCVAQRIDYDARARDTQIETDCEYAAGIVREIIHELATSPYPGTPVIVGMDSNERTPTAGHWQRSTVGRELQFLVSHTVHHYALIAVLLRCHGIEPPEDFGVAPSTIRHQKSCVPLPG